MLRECFLNHDPVQEATAHWPSYLLGRAWHILPPPMPEPLQLTTCWWQLTSSPPLEKSCFGWLHRRLLRRYRPQSAVNCSTLWEQVAGSLPSTSQVSLFKAPSLWLSIMREGIGTFWCSRSLQICPPLNLLYTAKMHCQASTRDSWRVLGPTLGVIVASRSYPMPWSQEHTFTLSISLTLSPHVVTLQGMLLSAKCSAKATCETPWASSRDRLPNEKSLWQASLQLETYQLSHW